MTIGKNWAKHTFILSRICVLRREEKQRKIVKEEIERDQVKHSEFRERELKDWTLRKVDTARREELERGVHAPEKQTRGERGEILSLQKQSCERVIFDPPVLW